MPTTLEAELTIRVVAIAEHGKDTRRLIVIKRRIVYSNGKLMTKETKEGKEYLLII